MIADGSGFDEHDDQENTLSQLSIAVMAAKVLERSREDGVPMNELSLDTQGGKIRAVTQREKKASDELRRQELVKKLRQRTVRGDNSLSDDVTNRLKRCQEWIDYISRFSSASEKDLVTIRRNLEGMNNRASSLIKEVTVLEMAIQRKKEEDPIISKVENASREIMEAMKNKDLEKVAELRLFCEQNIPAYNSRKKRLKPYLNQARQARLKFLTEKRQVMRMQFDTGGQVVELLANDLSTGKFSQFDQEALQYVTELIHSLRSLRSSGKVKMDILARPIGNVALSFIKDIETEMRDVDDTILLMLEEKIDALMAAIGIALRQLREQGEQGSRKEKDEKRMAFQQKKDSK